MEIKKFQFKRVNPFQGLVIDADTWQDAHSYHRDQQRLHILAFHDTGIVSGLEVTAFNPPDYSVNINTGMAVDPEGNVIIVPQKQRYRLKTPGEKGTIYLIIQFSEIPGEPFQPPEGGQATRILEAYRIQERDFLPTEPYVELARIEFDPSQPAFKDAAHQNKPGLNEIDLRYRKNARKPATAEPAPAGITPPPPVVVGASSKETILVGYASLGDSAKDLHLNGLKFAVQEFSRRSNYNVIVEDQINLNKTLSRYNLLYFTGNTRFELTAEQLSVLRNYLQSGGIIIGDGCSCPVIGVDVKGAREFGLAFNRWASRLECKLEIVKRGHPLLVADCIFSEVPPGCEPAILLEGGNMVCNSSDYGCAWTGGYPEQPLSRETIREACEMGCNIITYALKARSGGD